MAKKIGNSDALQAAIADLINKPDKEKPGDEWKTSPEWGEIVGIGNTTILEKLNRLVESGEWEKQPCHKKDKRGIYRLVPHYRKKP